MFIMIHRSWTGRRIEGNRGAWGEDGAWNSGKQHRETSTNYLDANSDEPLGDRYKYNQRNHKFSDTMNYTRNSGVFDRHNQDPARDLRLETYFKNSEHYLGTSSLYCHGTYRRRRQRVFGSARSAGRVSRL